LRACGLVLERRKVVSRIGYPSPLTAPTGGFVQTEQRDDRLPLWQAAMVIASTSALLWIGIAVGVGWLLG
jgi:hypothetical protein